MASAGLAMCPTMMVSTMPIDIQPTSARMRGTASVSTGRIWARMDILFFVRCGGRGLPQGCYCGKVFIVDNLRVDFGGLNPSGTYCASTHHAIVEDSLCQVSQV